MLAGFEVLLHGQYLSDVDTKFAKKVVVESHKFHLPHGREQLSLLYGVERVVDNQFPSSTSYGSRGDEDYLNALLSEPSYLIYQRRHTGDIEFAVLTCQYIRANLNYYSFFHFSILYINATSLM